MCKLSVEEEIRKKFSLLESVANVYIVKDDKSFCSAYCDFLVWLRRESGVFVQLCVFRPDKHEVCFYGDKKHALKLLKAFNGCLQQDWRGIYCWWTENKNLASADIVKVLWFL